MCKFELLVDHSYQNLKNGANYIGSLNIKFHENLLSLIYFTGVCVQTDEQTDERSEIIFIKLIRLKNKVNLVQFYGPNSDSAFKSNILLTKYL